MKKFLMASLFITVTLVGLSSCGSSNKIEMTESKKYHFDSLNLTMSVPVGWEIIPMMYKNKQIVQLITVRSGPSRVSKDGGDILFYVVEARKEHGFTIPDFDKQGLKKFGDYFIYVPTCDPENKTVFNKRCGLFINDQYTLGLFFDNFPKNEVTPELEAIFNSFRIDN